MGPTRYGLSSPLLRQILPLQCLHRLRSRNTHPPCRIPVRGVVRINGSRRTSSTWSEDILSGFYAIVIPILPTPYPKGASSCVDQRTDEAQRIRWHTSMTFIPTVQTDWRFVLYGNGRHDCHASPLDAHDFRLHVRAAL